MKFSANPLITLLAAIWIVPQMPAASPTTLSKVVVALKPDKDPDAMVAESAQLSKYLSDKLGRPVEVIVPLSAAVILEGLSNGTIDLAYLSATDMLNAINQRTASILLAGEIDGKTSYQSYWVTLNDKPYQSVADLKGKSGSSILRFGLLSFSPTVVKPHSFVGSQELLVESDRAARQPQRLRIRKLRTP